MSLFAPKPPVVMTTAFAFTVTVSPFAPVASTPQAAPLSSSRISVAVVFSSTSMPRFSTFSFSSGTT